MDMNSSVISLKGVGEKKEQALRRLGINTIEDLVHFYPREYQDRRTVRKIIDLREGDYALVKAKVKIKTTGRSAYGKNQMMHLVVSDTSDDTEEKRGLLEIIFFNAKFIIKNIDRGKIYVFYGKVTENDGVLRMVHPEFAESSAESICGILPVYHITEGISQREMRKWHKQIVGESKYYIKEYLPEKLLKSNNLCGINYAFSNIHFPCDAESLKAARKRLIYDEFFIMQMGIMLAKRENEITKSMYRMNADVCMNEYTNTLQYELTKAQMRVVREIDEDLVSGKVMNRLVQGNVGSGKTTVAEAALYKTVRSGYQGALMAPTEILAKQHFEFLKEHFSKFDITAALLTGSLKSSERREVLGGIKDGTIDIIVGTHAIIQPDVDFKDLALVITDEQHRFGVSQRNILRGKGKSPHVIVMTATPIPRTLAVVIYGDMDISVIDELPPGRKKIKTYSVSADKKERRKVYDFVERQIDEGRQAYVVAPLIRESDEVEALSAEGIYAGIKKMFKGKRIGLIHSEMKQTEKDRVMEAFYSGLIDVLVATVVIEVGIDVPNATVMVIENAERFGLAQLHQLRGRIGRGKHRSYCFLVNAGGSEIAKKRIEILTGSNDGFYIAEEDLKIRGPGEFFGMRQHGVPDLHMADLIKHIKIFNKVCHDVNRILDEDPELRLESNKLLREKIKKNFFYDSGITI